MTMNGDLAQLRERFPILNDVQSARETVWLNPEREEAVPNLGLTMEDVNAAADCLVRFAPFIRRRFPETEDRQGIIESPLTPIPRMQAFLNEKYRINLQGRLLLKQDSHLAIAGSVKARGGIYEVLKHTEDLALCNGVLHPGESYAVLAEEKKRDFFHQYTIQVGSTGNLGMSIGIMSAAIGYHAIVHMSADAKQWKKDLLRSHGVTVLEYDSDYSGAVRQGRRQSEQNPKSYFVDDENSKDLFLGYAVAAKRLAVQLDELGIAVDAGHPLFVYIPCGVGGAPGGITFGLKQIFGKYVHSFFVEPVQAPCMLVGMATGLHDKICVQDVGLRGLTDADGLAVGRPSGFVSGMMRTLLSGEVTVRDAALYDYLRGVMETEGIFMEPSACAAFQGPVMLCRTRAGWQYMSENSLAEQMDHAAHIVWATGGSLVPADVREKYLNTYL